jgi:hypothetical protein
MRYEDMRTRGVRVDNDEKKGETSQAGWNERTVQGEENDDKKPVKAR